MGETDDAPRAAIRIAEVTAIACLHTYTSSVYSQMLKDYGIVEPNEDAFTAWTIDMIPEIVMQWLANEDLNTNIILDLAEGKGVTIATEIHTVMGQRDGSNTST